MNYRFSPDARIDLLAAADFYELQRLGLGAEFVADVDAGISRVLDAPPRWPELEPGVRRYRLDRFPYALIYRITSSEVVDIVAVFHLHRKPGTWRGDRNL
jgi:toxin ParE1/3/4